MGMTPAGGFWAQGLTEGGMCPDDYDVQFFPRARSQRHQFGSAGYSIMATSKRKDEAWEWIKFCASREGMELSFPEPTTTPVRRSTRRSTPGPAPPLAGLLRHARQVSGLRPHPRSPQQAAAETALVKNVLGAVTASDAAGVRRSLDTMQRDLELALGEKLMATTIPTRTPDLARTVDRPVEDRRARRAAPDLAIVGILTFDYRWNARVPRRFGRGRGALQQPAAEPGRGDGVGDDTEGAGALGPQAQRDGVRRVVQFGGCSEDGGLRVRGDVPGAAAVEHHRNGTARDTRESGHVLRGRLLPWPALYLSRVRWPGRHHPHRSPVGPVADTGAVPYRVMTICTGNICRSPMAEVVLRQRFAEAGLEDQVVVDSSGISDEEHGNPVDRRAASVLREHDYDVPAHRAHQATREEISDRDLLLAMTSRHARWLRTQAPDEASAARVVMYRSFDPASADLDVSDESDLDIDDPWYGDRSGFEGTLEQIEAAADAIVEHVRRTLRP